ncbi:MAG TPA: hypothetical protein PK629_04445 [Oscillospiraceae bacterium]|nr:hypothetical protein [Oscillospiraceae bacterium]HPF55670.1 hypothetical protein [Clostridiales bacterium]HPK35134.1 hypothetical protein [Oscillospiraceae bacterium]HPR74937.1 hypothetical protein [Oscillospiraceae bacterium]
MMKKFLAILLASFVLICGCVNSNVTDSSELDESNIATSSAKTDADRVPSTAYLDYDEFYSQERLYRDETSPYMYDSRFTHKRNSTTGIHTLTYKDSVTGLEKEWDPKTEGEITDFAITYLGLVIVTGGNRILECGFNTENRKILYESKSSIKELFAYSEIIYFLTEDGAVYSIHRQSGELDLIIQNAEIVSFEPLSNYAIVLNKYNPEWLEKYADTQEADDPNISMYLGWIYDVSTGKTREFSIEEYDNKRKDYYSQTSNDGADVDKIDLTFKNDAVLNYVDCELHYSAYSGTVNGNAVPTSTYPIGSYIGNNEGGTFQRTACTHHSSACGVNACDCYVMESAIQCAAFAKRVYKNFFGSTTAGTNIPLTSINSTTDAQNFFQGLIPGARIYCAKSDYSGSHQFMVISTDSVGIVLYHANYTGPCKIAISYFTYAELDSKYRNADGYDGVHTVHSGTWQYYSPTQHRRVCTICGAIQYGTHYIDGPAGWGNCAVCGAYGNWPGSSK